MIPTSLRPLRLNAGVEVGVGLKKRSYLSMQVFEIGHYVEQKKITCPQDSIYISLLVLKVK